MEHINHFKQDIVTFDLDGVFEYKPLMAEDELEMDLSYCYDQSGFNVGKFNVLRLAHNLKKVPYSIETIKNITGKEVEWSGLGISDRIKLLVKLSTSVFKKILDQTDAVDYADADLKKKSRT